MRVCVPAEQVAELAAVIGCGHRVRAVAARFEQHGGHWRVRRVPHHRHLTVQTARPAPAEFATLFRAALAEGADEVVSVHLSRELAGTWDAARLAAQEVGADRVRVVDSRATAMGLGFAVLAAADATDRGAGGAAVQDAAPTSPRVAACSSVSTPWIGCVVGAGSARQPRSSAVRWR